MRTARLVAGSCALAVMLVATAVAGAGPTPPGIPAARVADVSGDVRAAIDDARARLEQAQERKSAPAVLAAAWGHLGDVFFIHDFAEQARTSYRRAAELEPGEFAWPYMLGMVELSTGDIAAAIQALDEALALAPDNHAARIRRGRALRDSGELTLAEEDFARALELMPGSAAALGGLGRVALERGRHQEAVELLEQALQQEPAASGLQHSLGMAYRGLGEVDRARHHLGLRGDRDPEIPDPLLSRVQMQSRSPQFFLELGLSLADRGDFEGALAMMARVLQLDPEHAHALLNSGELLARLDRFDEAHAVFTRLVEVDTASGDGLFYLGQVEELRGNPGAASEAYQKALEIEATHADARQALAGLLLQAGQFERAAEQYLRLAEASVTPAEQVEYRYWHGMAEIGAGDCHSAQASLEQADELSPQPIPAILEALVRLHSTCIRGDAVSLQQMTDIAERLYNANPGLDSAETLAMVYAASGRFDDAVDLQAHAIFEALKNNMLGQRPELQQNLARYESGEPALQPYASLAALSARRAN